MKNKKGIVGITLAVIMIASIFAAVAPPVSAPSALAVLVLQKTTIDCATLVENPLASYYVGDTVCYKMVITNPSSTLNWTGNTHDDYPNGTTETLDTGLILDPLENKTYYRTYVVNSADVARGYVINGFCVVGKDGLGNDASGDVETYNTILSEEVEPPEFLFTFVGIGCLEVEFDGSASFDPDGTIVNHTWYFGDGASGVLSGASGIITHTYSTCGVKIVTLEGYDNDGNYNCTIELIYVDCGPTAIASATTSCFEPNGTWITFNGSASHVDTNNPDLRSITWWDWAFSDGISGTSDHAAITSRWVNDTVTATLTVSDGHCEDTCVVSLTSNIAEYYDMTTHGGNGNQVIDIDEVIHAVMDYLNQVYPFGPEGMFNRCYLRGYILFYLSGEEGFPDIPNCFDNSDSIVDFTWDRACCRNISFTGWSSDPGNITNHTWNFGDGTLETYSGYPGTVYHQYTQCGFPLYAANLSGYDRDGQFNSTWDFVWADCDPTPVITFTPSCFEGTGGLITFNGSNSYADTTANLSNTVTWWNWTFSDGNLGSSDDTAVTSRWVNDTLTATLNISDGHCYDTGQVTVGPCSQCSIRLYGIFGQGPGDDTVDDPETGLPPENKPYSDPIGPFYPQNGQAPREDFITFNPAIMDLQQGKEKVFKRMWYEKEWFVDQNTNGVWDVVMYDGEVMTLDEWLAIPAWERPTLREWNGPNLPNHNPDADIYGPAINQEFTYMFLDDATMPIMIGDGSSVLIPMASYEQHNGLDSFDADGDGLRDHVLIESEQTVGIDIDGDGVLEPMDKDATALNGNECVVLKLENKFMSVVDTLQFFDHRVTLIDVQSAGTESLAIFSVCDNEGGGSQRCTENVVMNLNDVQTFYRARPGNLGERPTFYLRLITADAGSNTATVEIGRMFGQTYANIEANPYRSQKAFMVDGVLYNVVAIKSEDNCIKYISFRQTLPKLPIQLFGKHLECWAPGEILPEMPPFNMNHEIMADVMREWPDEPPASQQDKIGVVEPRPPLEIDYIYEDTEFRYRGELKEIYAVDPPEEWWNLEWYLTLPRQFTEFRLPHDDKYLVTLSWYANESELVLWGSDPNEPEDCRTGERVNFWYQDCTGPLYINDDTSSIRLYGTFGEGAGNQNAVDPYTTLPPENKPYTDPVGPFDQENEQAPGKDFMTFNPAIMEYTHGYPELEFFECPGGIVPIPKEKVFKRMWYEKSWFNDHDSDGEWDIVIEQYSDTQYKWVFYDVMALAQWNALPEYEKIINQLRLRVWNSPDAPDWKSDADIYGPAINQEFTYMFLDEETMPIMIGDGSSVLIPMASYEQGSGLNSFDADGDGIRDAVLVESEQTVGIDIDGDGVLEPMDEDSTELNGNESVVLRLEDKFMSVGDTIQFFDHLVTLIDVQSTGTESLAIFNVCDNEGGGSQRCTENVMIEINGVRTFYRGRPGNLAEKPVFYLRLITADAIDNTAIVEVGRMFGQTHANIGANPYRSQKAFMVDDVFYNVVAIKAEDNCIGYISFRQTLPKVPINLFGKDLKWWAPDEILPEMPPFNMDHEIFIDVQTSWTRPYSQQDKIGPKMPSPLLEITWLDETIELRFKGALKEIYCENESTGDEFWTEEWFWTKPWQYTAFVMPEGQGLYLMTLAWYAPGSEITIWNNDSNGPASYYTGERVKFWYDPADNTDLYVNRVGEIPPPPTIEEYYDRASNGGNGDGEIDFEELLNALLDYSDEVYPFGINGLFDKDDLCDYLLAFIDQVSGYSVTLSSTINEYYDLPSNGGDGDDRIDPQELAQAILDYLNDDYPFGPGGIFSKLDLLAYIEDYIDLECLGIVNNPPNPPSILQQLKSDSATEIPVGDTTDERTVVFKGYVSDPDGDKVKLQVELRRLDEYSGQFDETKGGLKESVLVENGSEAVAYAYGLIDADYHWRARAVDEHGELGEWVDFGDNDISEADFSVKVNNRPTASFSYTTDGLLSEFTSTSHDIDEDLLTYYWDFGDGSISTEQNPSHYYELSGTYFATLVVKDIHDRMDSITKQISVSSKIKSVSHPSDISNGLPLHVNVETEQPSNVRVSIADFLETKYGNNLDFNIGTSNFDEGEYELIIDADGELYRSSVCVYDLEKYRAITNGLDSLERVSEDEMHQISRITGYAIADTIFELSKKITMKAFLDVLAGDGLSIITDESEPQLLKFSLILQQTGLDQNSAHEFINLVGEVNSLLKEDIARNSGNIITTSADLLSGVNGKEEILRVATDKILAPHVVYPICKDEEGAIKDRTNIAKDEVLAHQYTKEELTRMKEILVIGQEAIRNTDGEKIYRLHIGTIPILDKSIDAEPTLYYFKESHAESLSPPSKWHVISTSRWMIGMTLAEAQSILAYVAETGLIEATPENEEIKVTTEVRPTVAIIPLIAGAVKLYVKAVKFHEFVSPCVISGGMFVSTDLLANEINEEHNDTISGMLSVSGFSMKSISTPMLVGEDLKIPQGDIILTITPDGRIVDIEFTKTDVSVKPPAEYTIISLNAGKSYKIEAEKPNVTLQLIPDKENYTLNQTADITVNITNNMNETINDTLLWFVVPSENLTIKDSLNLSSNSETILNYNFTVTNESLHVPSAFLTIFDEILAEGHCSFTVGSGIQEGAVMTIDHEEFYDPGLVTMNVTIENVGNVELNSMLMYDGSFVSLPPLQPNDAVIQVATFNHTDPGIYTIYFNLIESNGTLDARCVAFTVRAIDTLLAFPTTDKPNYDLSESINVSVIIKNATLHQVSFPYELKITTPSGEIINETHFVASENGTYIVEASPIAAGYATVPGETLFMVEKQSDLKMAVSRSGNTTLVHVKTDAGGAVEDASVILNGIKKSTDIEGVAKFEYVNATEFFVKTEKFGFNPVIKTVNISEENLIFDTDSPANPYPSISGIHNGTIKPNHTINVSTLYTYLCSGTGGHTEYARIWNNSGLDVNATWNGYVGDWYNITFNETFVLYQNEMYNYTIRTGSYPQIIHESPFNATGGTITCTKFTDANGKTYNNCIPAVRLWA